MLPGELQVSSWEARGCVRRSFFVRFLYLSKASLIINCKSEDEEDEESAGRVSAIEVRVRKIVRYRGLWGCECLRAEANSHQGLGELPHVSVGISEERVWRIGARTPLINERKSRRRSDQE